MNVLLICLPLLLAGVSLTYSLGGEEELVTLPFGDPLGDHFGPHGADAVSNEIMLEGKYIFYGHEETSLFISENGVISFRAPFSDPFPSNLPLTNDSGTSSTPALIAGFWGDIDVQKNGGAIFFGEQYGRNNKRFGKSKAHVLNLLREGYGGSLEDFEPTHIFLTTWETVHEYGEQVFKRAVTFQIVLVTDSVQTYVLLLYADVRWNTSNEHGVLVGFNAGDGVRSFTHPLYTKNSILDLDFETNARRNGVFVYRVDQDHIIEPTEEQRNEDICVLSYVAKAARDKRFPCKCPTEEKPVLAFNKINCLLPPLSLKFFNDTPAVSGDSVTAYFRASRPNVEIRCHIPKTDRRAKEDCSSGFFHHSGMRPGRYSIRVIARDPFTRERAVLRGSFTIPDEKSSGDEKDHCGVTIINTGTQVKYSDVSVYFAGTGASEEFVCRIDKGSNRSCESPFELKDLSPGDHRVVVVPSGPECDPSNTKAASVRFTVTKL